MKVRIEFSSDSDVILASIEMKKAEFSSALENLVMSPSIKDFVSILQRAKGMAGEKVDLKSPQRPSDASTPPKNGGPDESK